MESEEEGRPDLEGEEGEKVPGTFEDDYYEQHEQHGPGDEETAGEDERPASPAATSLAAGTTPRSKRGRPPGVLNASVKPPSRPGTPPPLEIPRADGTERGNFLHDLYSFMARIGQPITKVPHLGYQELDLYRLYQLVIARGGMDEVTRRQEWKTVYQELGIPTMSTSASYNTRTNYKKHLYLYELEHCDFNDRRPAGAEPRFVIGEYVRIVSSNYEGQVFYAKVLKCRWRQAKNHYYVHYNGWSNSHDEWMPETVLSKLLPEESSDPDALVNPHPNRSSKSNYIIGEPPTAGEHKQHRAKKPSGALSAGGTSAATATEESEEETEVYARGGPSPGRRDVRSLRVKLRGRDQPPHHHQPTAMSTAGPGSMARGPSAETIQSELEKLEDERFLEYHPPARPKFLTAANAHRYNEERAVGKLRQDLLQTVDMRVPNIENLVGEPPIKPDSSALGRPTLAPGGEEENDRRDNIAALERELRAIKQEYRRKRKLLNLYYGPSESSSGAESSSNGETDGHNGSSINSENSGTSAGKSKREAMAPATPSPRRTTRRSR